MYHKELARSGKALFTIRGAYIYTVIIGSILIAWASGNMGPFGEAGADLGWQVAGFVVALGAAIWRIIIGGYAALGTSGNAKKQAVAAELNTTGPYSVVRNPLYVGRIMNFTGLAMLSGSWVYAAIVFLVSVLIYERISIYEELFLADKFGDAHAKWAESVPALLPRLTGWVKPKYPFWWRRAIRREYKKLFQLATAVIACDFARRGFELPENLTLYYVYAGCVVLRLAVGAARQFGKAFDGIE
ncbi:MAG: isoprenylcysteine carboxylmethyltransferase family protein [Blastomonas sp.]